MKTFTFITDAAFDRACQNLGKFVLMQAARVSKHVGFSYREFDDSVCPSNLHQINTEWHFCQRNLYSYPISNAGNDTSIYGHAGNLAFRFWHDFIHHDLQLTTKLEDEIKASEIHARVVAKAFGQDSLEARIIRADVEGQAIFYNQTGHFVSDQRAFVLAQLESSAY